MPATFFLLGRQVVVVVGNMIGVSSSSRSWIFERSCLLALQVGGRRVRVDQRVVVGVGELGAVPDAALVDRAERRVQEHVGHAAVAVVGDADVGAGQVGRELHPVVVVVVVAHLDRDVDADLLGRVLDQHGEIGDLLRGEAVQRDVEAVGCRLRPSAPSPRRGRTRRSGPSPLDGNSVEERRVVGRSAALPWNRPAMIASRSSAIASACRTRLSANTPVGATQVDLAVGRRRQAR